MEGNTKYDRIEDKGADELGGTDKDSKPLVISSHVSGAATRTDDRKVFCGSRSKLRVESNTGSLIAQHGVHAFPMFHSAARFCAGDLLSQFLSPTAATLTSLTTLSTTLTTTTLTTTVLRSDDNDNVT